MPAIHKTDDGDHDALRHETVFWDQYVKEAESFDKEIVKALDGDLSNLLIFAGLFSAVNTAVIAESYQTLQPDPINSGEVVLLLRAIASSIVPNTTTLPQSQNFVPTRNSVISNGLLFASLCLALFSAFGAVLAKQCLNEYERTPGAYRTPYARALHRQGKYLGLRKYKFEAIVHALGTILQMALMLFLIGLAAWLKEINALVAIVVVVGGAGSVVVLYGVTTVVAVCDTTAPFGSVFSRLLRRLLGLSAEPALRSDPSTEGLCIAWVRDHATSFHTIVAMSKASLLLPRHIQDSARLTRSDIAPVLLRSVLSSNAIWTSYGTNTLMGVVDTIRRVIDARTWEHLPAPLALDVLEQIFRVLATSISKDWPLSESIVLCLESVPTPLIDQAKARSLSISTDSLLDLMADPATTPPAKTAAASLLWRLSPNRDKGIYWAVAGNYKRLESVRIVASALMGTLPQDGSFDPDYSHFTMRLNMLSCISNTPETNKEDTAVWSSAFRKTPGLREYMLSWAPKAFGLQTNTVEYRCYAMNELSWMCQNDPEFSLGLFQVPNAHPSLAFCSACWASLPERCRQDVSYTVPLLRVAFSYNTAERPLVWRAFWAPLIIWYRFFRGNGKAGPGPTLAACRNPDHRAHWISSDEFVNVPFAVELFLQLGTVAADNLAIPAGTEHLGTNDGIPLLLAATRDYFDGLERVYSSSTISTFANKYVRGRSMPWPQVIRLDDPVVSGPFQPDLLSLAYFEDLMDTLKSLAQRFARMGCPWAGQLLKIWGTYKVPPRVGVVKSVPKVGPHSIRLPAK